MHHVIRKRINHQGQGYVREGKHYILLLTIASSTTTGRSGHCERDMASNEQTTSRHGVREKIICYKAEMGGKRKVLLCYSPLPPPPAAGAVTANET